MKINIGSAVVGGVIGTVLGGLVLGLLVVRHVPIFGHGHGFRTRNR